MEKQVCILFAGTKGFLDPMPVDTLADYEQQLYSYIEQKDPSIYSDLKEKQVIDSPLEEKLKKTLTAFGETFKASKGLS
jgi:F-type H+-transporting ATPase subunit alpha